jgi:hypothetical protein
MPVSQGRASLDSEFYGSDEDENFDNAYDDEDFDEEREEVSFFPSSSMMLETCVDELNVCGLVVLMSRRRLPRAKRTAARRLRAMTLSTITARYIPPLACEIVILSAISPDREYDGLIGPS